MKHASSALTIGQRTSKFDLLKPFSHGCVIINLGKLMFSSNQCCSEISSQHFQVRWMISDLVSIWEWCKSWIISFSITHDVFTIRRDSVMVNSPDSQSVYWSPVDTLCIMTRFINHQWTFCVYSVGLQWTLWVCTVFNRQLTLCVFNLLLITSGLPM